MRIFTLWCVVSLSFLPLTSEASRGDMTAHDWLDRMSVAVESLDYQGTLVQLRDGQIEAFEVVRRVDQAGVQERVSTLVGPAQEMIRRGDDYQSTLQGLGPGWFHSGFQSRLMPNQPVNPLASLGEVYEVQLGGVDRVAGYPAQRLDILPKDAYRYGQQLWLEQQTGMLLRFRVLDEAGQALYEQAFVNIEIGARVSDQALEPITGIEFTDPVEQASESDVTSLSGASAVGRVSGMLRPMWAPRRVPAHFRLVNANHGRSDVDSAFDHLLFSDGLTSFSVYIDHAPTQVVETRLETIGPVHILTGMMGQRQFTIMGQVPEQTVKFVGQQFLVERRSHRGR